MKIFISHIHEESLLANAIKDFIESSFPGHLSVFVSSNSDSVSPGERWFRKVEKAMEESNLFLVLCSNQSIIRPWINFETGCAFIKGIDVIPICHSGINKSNLPIPISQFQAVEIDGSFIENMVDSIKNRLRLTRTPKLDVSYLQNEINKAMQSIVVNGETPKNNISTIFELKQEEKNILIFMVRINKERYVVEEFESNFNFSKQKAKYHLENLMEIKYIDYVRNYRSGQWEYQLTRDGRKYIFDNNLV